MINENIFQFILKEIAKSNINRMNLTHFSRLVRKKVQHMPTSQLMYLYSQLQKLGSNRSQFHPHNHYINNHEPFRPKNINPIMNFQSYEKQALICLEQIAIKCKQKNGFDEGVDLCKLSYLRLLNVIQYNMPYLNVLEQFREEFIWRDVGEQVIDYVGLIQKDPGLYGKVFVDTMNIIIDHVAQELENIDVLQLPYLKSVLSKGKKYDAYQISDDLLERVDQIISQNRFAFTFGELEKCLTSNHKNQQTLEYYALLNKQMMDKRLIYLYVDSCNDQLIEQKQRQHSSIKNQMGLPGRIISQDRLNNHLRKMQNLSLFNTYLGLFTNMRQENRLKTISLTKQYIKYHFHYFSNSGNLNCNITEIINVLENTLQEREKSNNKEISLKHVEVLRLFFVIEMLLRSPVSEKQLKSCHTCLSEELQILNTIQKPKIEHVNKIFDGSIKYISIDGDIHQAKSLVHSFSGFVNKMNQNDLSKMISEELDDYKPGEKTFLINELIIFLISSFKNQQIRELSQSVLKLLQTLMKGQFKKYSVEAIKIQKIIVLVRQSQAEGPSEKMLSNSTQKQQIVPQTTRSTENIGCQKSSKTEQDPKSFFF